MDELQQYNYLFNSPEEEEKDYLFDEPVNEFRDFEISEYAALDTPGLPHSSLISFEQYNKALEADKHFGMDLEENCSDCDKDCESKLLADLPTNDSNSYAYEAEQEEINAKKFLSSIGVLQKADDNDLFLIDEFAHLESFEHEDLENHEIR